MDLRGEIPGVGQVSLTESQELNSLGTTSIIGDGRFRIDSFFDVFTEISAPNPFGGTSTFPASEPLRVTLVNSGVETNNPNLPPNDGVYRSPQQVHVEFQGDQLEIVLQDVAHRRFAVTDRVVERQ